MQRKSGHPMHREVRYAKNGAVHLAYQVVGEGPSDLVFVPGFVSHLEAAWEEPRFETAPRPSGAR